MSMATKHLKLRRSKADGYYRTSWVDDRGKRHWRRFGPMRAAAENEFSTFYALWKENPLVRNPDDEPALTIKTAWERFKGHATSYYVHADGTATREADNFGDAFRPALEQFKNLPLAEFGPAHLKACQVAMAESDLCVNTINARIRKLRHVFRWLAAEGLYPGGSLHALAAVLPLKAGRPVQVGPESLTPRTTGEVKPVPDAWVERTCRHLPPTLAAMVRFQRLTGARPQDVCGLTGGQLDTQGRVWLYRPTHHKTAYRGRPRIVLIGPRAQAVIQSFLKTDLAAPLFSPSQAQRERSQAARDAYVAGGGYDYRTWPSYQRRAAKGKVEAPGARGEGGYTPGSYALAIARVCDEHDIPHWSPNQLRHNAATQLRREFGLDVAQIALGHAHADTTEIYAEADLAKAVAAMERVG